MSFSSPPMDPFYDSDEETCPVCFELLNSPSYILTPGKTPNVLPECGHMLHEACFTAVYGPVQLYGSSRSKPSVGVCGICRRPMRVLAENTGTPQMAVTYQAKRVFPVPASYASADSTSNNIIQAAPKYSSFPSRQSLQPNQMASEVPESSRKIYQSGMYNAPGEMCQYPGCGKPVSRDQVSGKLYKHCGRDHARAAQTLSLQTSPRNAPFTFFPLPTAPEQVGPSKKFGLVICDMQENYRQTVHQFPSVLATVIRMIRVAEMFNIEIFVTHHWPSIYGECVPEILPQLSSVFNPSQQKNCYTKNGSFGSSQHLLDQLKRGDFTNVIVCGVEAHITIEAQVRALARNELAVHVLADGISSRNKEEVALSLDRLRQLAHTSDVSISTSESIAFYIMEMLEGWMEEGERRNMNTKLLGLIDMEQRGIASGLKNLLGNTGPSGLNEGSEVSD